MKRERDYYKVAAQELDKDLMLRNGKVKLQYEELLELRAFKKSKVLCAKCGESYARVQGRPARHRRVDEEARLERGIREPEGQRDTRRLAVVRRRRRSPVDDAVRQK